jgi:pyridoxine 5-phosphate synthase
VSIVLKLGVNIDHIATLRQARYKTAFAPGVCAVPGGLVPEPDVTRAALEVETAGAHGITVHLREDRRHIHDSDVRQLRQTIHIRLNLEMADVPEIVAIAGEIRPDEVCLVPENRQELTTEGGLNVIAGAKSLTQTIARLKRAGIVVSLFVDPDVEQIRAAADVGADYIELHTGAYADARGTQKATEVTKLIAAATLAHERGLRVNAGHGLNYENTPGIFVVPHLDTLNTGHAIVSRAVFVGLRQAVSEMLKVMTPYKG